jgi:hypothetical protein
MTTPNRFTLNGSFAADKVTVNGNTFSTSHTKVSGVETNEKREAFVVLNTEDLDLYIGDVLSIVATGDVTDSHKNETFEARLTLYNGEVVRTGENFLLKLTREKNSSDIWDLVVFNEAV